MRCGEGMGTALLAVWLMAFVPAIAAAGDAGVRIALICEDHHEHTEGVLVLTEARLTGATGLIVVDRREINRIMAEQSLSLAGMSPVDFTVQSGEIIGADVFAFIGADDGGNVLGLSVFDAATSLRFWDETLPEMAREDIPDYLAARITAALAKRTPAGVRVTTFGLLSARNRDLPRSYDTTLQGIARLLERRLNHSERLSIVERQRLGRMGEEWQLLGHRQDGAVEPSLILGELELSRAPGSEAPMLALRLVDATNQPLAYFERPLWDGQLPELIDALSAEVCQYLESGCSAAVADRRAEAEQYRAESLHAYGHQRLRAATEAMEAAYVLDPDRKAIQGRLMRCLLEYGWQILNPDYFRYRGPIERVSPEDLERVISLGMRALDVHALLAGEFPQKTIPTRPRASYGRFYAYFEKLAFVAESNFDDHTAPLLVELQDRFRALVNRQATAHRARVTDQETFQQYTLFLASMVLFQNEMICATADQWVDDTLQHVEGWLSLAAEYDLFKDHANSVNRLLLRLMVRTEQMSCYPPAQGISQWQLEGKHFARMLNMFERMAGHRHPVVRVYGHAGRLWAQQQMADLPEGAAADAFRRVSRQMQETLGDREWGTSAERALMYQAGLDAIEVLPQSADRRREHAALFDAMMDNREIAYNVVHAAIATGFLRYSAWGDVSSRSHESVPRPEWPERMARLDAVLAAVQSDDYEMLFTSQDEVSGALEAIRQPLVSDMPELPEVGTTPWTRARKLVDCRESGYAQMSPPHVDEGAGRVYYVAVERGGLSLYRVDMVTGDKEPLGHVAVAGIPQIVHPTPLQRPVVRKNYVAFAVRGNGIFIYTPHTQSIRRIGLGEGLPSEAIQAIAGTDAGLFYVAGAKERETYMGFYDLATDTHRLIASTARLEPQNDFDNDWPYEITFMHYDEPRQRILFLRSVTTTMAMSRQSEYGLWSYDLGNEKLNLVVPLWVRSNGGQVYPDGRILLFAAESGLRFNPADDSVEVLYARPGARLSRELFADSARLSVQSLPPAPQAWIDDWLWITEPFGRVSMDGKIRETFNVPDATLARSAWYWTLLAPVEQPSRGVVAANYDAIWHLVLEESP